MSRRRSPLIPMRASQVPAVAPATRVAWVNSSASGSTCQPPRMRTSGTRSIRDFGGISDQRRPAISGRSQPRS